MDNMLRAVLDTDHHESERTEQLIKTREMIFDELREQKDVLFAEAKREAGDDISAIMRRLEAQKAARLGALRAQGESALRKLTEYGISFRETLADEIVSLVLNG